jgi:hypothetical protein
MGMGPAHSLLIALNGFTLSGDMEECESNKLELRIPMQSKQIRWSA